MPRLTETGNHLFMRKLFIFAIPLFIHLCMHSFCFGQTQIEKWNLYHPVKKTWMEVGSHGSVQEFLFYAGELPDPFYGENEDKYTWIENYDWVFETQFFLTEEQFNSPFLELEFPGIDTYASVYLNDSLILEANNAFRPYRLQIKNIVKCGYNQLRLIFQSPINYHRDAYQARSSKLPAPNDVGKMQVASMSRKPQYQFGWDWALRMNTIGLIKPAILHTYSENRFILPQVITQKIDQNEAQLAFRIASVLPTRFLKIKSNLVGEHQLIEMNSNNFTVNVQLKNPELWWPRGHGKANLYADVWEIYNLEGELLQTIPVQFGIKTSELVQEQDQWGTSFYFKINGKPIFAKGANYIPQDVFQSRISDASLRKMVNEMYISNFNMVRVWGGGFYQEEAFYKACDEKGIMVWQDFMFACAMYPGDEAFMHSVSSELEYQIPRIAAHPAVVYFNGNNEVDVAWKNWGFQAKYRIGPKMQRQIEADYNALFKQMIPNYVQKFSSIPYEHTSPLSNWGKDEYFDHGTMHYWGVWHGKDPIEDFGRKTGRFNAEYGFQSFPEFSTLLTFSEKKDWNLNSKVMKHHQKSYVGNGMIKKHADILYGEAKSVEEFIYLSQLTQAKAVGIAIAGHRINAPRSMGTLYWQLNDCWQAPTWSSIDYFGNWKALQYQAQKDFEDVAIVEKIDKIGEERYFLISDQSEYFTTVVRQTIYDLGGKILSTDSTEIHVTGNWLQEVGLICQDQLVKSQNYVVSFEWKNAQNKVLNRTFYHGVKERNIAKLDQVSVEIKSIDEIHKTARIKITNSAFLQNFWISSLKLGVRFDSNFEHLLPGEHWIDIQFDELPLKEDFILHWL